MTRKVPNRTVSLAALAAAVGLIALAAPSWSCPTTGARSSSSGNASQGSDFSRDNGAGESQRQGVDAAAGEGLGVPGVVGSRGAGSDAAPDPNAQIGAVSQARASGDAAQCRALKAELAALTGDNAPDPYARVKSEQRDYSRAVQMTPAMLDTEIASQKAELDRVLSFGMTTAKRNVQTLSFLMDLRTAQALGFGVDDVKAKASQRLMDATRDAQQVAANAQAHIRDLNAQISDLKCDNFLPVSSASNQ